MIYYTLPYILIVLASILSLKIKRKGYKYLFLLSFIPAVIIVTMRGLVGTDTYSYLSLLEQTKWDIEENIYNLEFGFVLYLKLVNFLEIFPQKALNAFSLITCILLYLNFSKSRNAFIVFSSIVFPVFFYDMTMNGLRYGLAFALAVPFITEPSKEILKFNRIKIYFILSLLNHNSVLVFLFSKILLNLNIKKFILGLLFFTLVLYYLQDYLLLKFNSYSDLASPGALSGLQPLVIMFLLSLTSSIFFKNKVKRNAYLFAIQLLFYGVTQFSYAGLRFQFVILFFMMVSMINDRNCSNYKIYISSLYLIGLVGFLLKARNMLDTYGIGPSPYLPYLFYWQ